MHHSKHHRILFFLITCMLWLILQAFLQSSLSAMTVTPNKGRKSHSFLFLSCDGFSLSWFCIRPDILHGAMKLGLKWEELKQVVPDRGWAKGLFQELITTKTKSKTKVTLFLFLRILVDVENLEIVSSCRPLQLSQCVDRGVNLLVRDSGGCSALHLAAQSGHADLVRYILQQGEKVHVK